MRRSRLPGEEHFKFRAATPEAGRPPFATLQICNHRESILSSRLSLIFQRDKTRLRTMKKILYTSNRWIGGVLLAACIAVAGTAVGFDITSKNKAEHPSVNVPIDETAVGRDSLPHGS